MMLLYRLVRLIETHSQALAASLLLRVQESDQVGDYRNVPPEELKQRVYEIYRHLGDWLLGKTEFDIEKRYVEIGMRRAEQHVPFSQVAMVIVLTKENLWEFLKKESVIDRPVDVFGELEMLQLLEQFFDHAIYYAAIGYERAVAAGARETTAAGKTVLVLEAG
ncbi:MAG: hypothetical protein LAO09_23325, partial [Acidobacteriia bacterium]|nr:hypothetical protein [Terriglobia bacterium]